MHRHMLPAGAFAIVLALASPARSQSASECGDPNPERSIIACTFTIDANVGGASDIAIAYYNRGNAYASQGQFDRAIGDYTAAIARHPGFPGAYNNRANALSALGRYAEAIADYSQTIELNPAHMGARFNRGVSFAKLGQLDPAIADLTEVVRLKPDNAVAYFSRGLMYARQGNREQALNDMRRTLEIDPAHAGATQALRTLAAQLN